MDGRIYLGYLHATIENGMRGKTLRNGCHFNGYRNRVLRRHGNAEGIKEGKLSKDVLYSSLKNIYKVNCGTETFARSQGKYE